ncbi:hypothetical protein DOTSEDRAFT_32478 [Dothistroma septosporum NZE10]|uniref:Uncharacterized protein n=1 Tax=Dothistroma septosporum (strain NZE10 / CBS 128990) TaxID=675120 RepID=N1PXN6_DOTSN|nr:hypothetical protein DOTSEDRAFT_32478 [Dothistroma septosporum NZE10]
MALASQLLKSLVSTLDLCRLCEERNLGDDRAGASKHDFDIEYDDSTISKVRFTDCDLKNVLVKNGNWKSVTFTDCRFSDTTFRGVKLENAQCYNVDFRQVTFHEIKLKDVQWVGEFLNNAYVSQEAFSYTGMKDRHSMTAPVTGGLPIRVLQSTRYNKTTGGFNYREARREDFKEGLLARSDLTPVELMVPSRRQPQLLELPDKILSSIVAITLPPDRIKILEFPTGLDAPMPVGQTLYPRRHNGRGCTYTGWHVGVPARNFAGNAGVASSLRICTGLLGVNKKRHELGVMQLYNRLFWFSGLGDAFLAFLHDHSDQVQHIRFSGFGNSPLWERASTIVTYHCPKLKTLTVQWDGSLWHSPMWKFLHGLRATYLTKWKLITDAAVAGTLQTRENEALSQQLQVLKLIVNIPMRKPPRKLNVFIYITGQEDNETQESIVKLLNSSIRTARSKLSIPSLMSKHICTKKQLKDCPFGLNAPRHLLSLPQGMLSWIFEHTVPCRAINVLDRSGHIIRPTNNTQTTYLKPRCTHRPSQTGTSYVCLASDLVPCSVLRSSYDKLNLPTQLLLTSKKCYDLALPILYGSTFRFMGSIEAGLSSMHDVPAKVPGLMHLEVRYNECTDSGAWRNLFNILVHEVRTLKNLTLHLTASFWDKAPWKRGVDAALSWRGWERDRYDDDSDDEYGGYNGRTINYTEHNFLTHVARLPQGRVWIGLVMEGVENHVD